MAVSIGERCSNPMNRSALNEISNTGSVTEAVPLMPSPDRLILSGDIQTGQASARGTFASVSSDAPSNAMSAVSSRCGAKGPRACENESERGRMGRDPFSGHRQPGQEISQHTRTLFRSDDYALVVFTEYCYSEWPYGITESA